MWPRDERGRRPKPAAFELLPWVDPTIWQRAGDGLLLWPRSVWWSAGPHAAKAGTTTAQSRDGISAQGRNSRKPIRRVHSRCPAPFPERPASERTLMPTSSAPMRELDAAGDEDCAELGGSQWERLKHLEVHGSERDHQARGWYRAGDGGREVAKGAPPHGTLLKIMLR